MPSRPSPQTADELPAHASPEFDDVLDQWLRDAAGLPGTRKTRERDRRAPGARGGVGAVPGSPRPAEQASGWAVETQGGTGDAAEPAGQEVSGSRETERTGITSPPVLDAGCTQVEPRRDGFFLWLCLL